MRIDEIEIIGDFDDDRNQYRFDAFYQNASRGGRTIGRLPSGLQVLNEDNIYYVTTAKGDLVGSARIEDAGKYLKVNHIWFRPEYRGRGIGYQFYRFLLDELGLTIVSDRSQTRFAKGVWERLARDGYVYDYSYSNEGTDRKIGQKVWDVSPYYSDSENRDKLKSLLIATRGEVHAGA